jgi:hypothetical protein
MEGLKMDVNLGAYNEFELSGTYQKGLNESLHVGISQDQDMFSKFNNTRNAEINDTFSKPNRSVIDLASGAKNITDYMDVEFIGSNRSIERLSIMLQYGANAEQRSLFEAAKVYEEEWERVMGLTDITEKERDLRLHILDSAFVDASRFLFSQTATNDTGRNFDTLTNFTQNAIKNIQASGLSERTQRLMIQAMDRTVTFYKDEILFQDLSKMVNQRSVQKGWGLTSEEVKAIAAERNKIYKQQLDRLKSILNNPFNQSKWISTVIPDKKVNSENDSLNITDEENIDDESIDDESIDDENIDEDDTVDESSSENSTTDGN